MLETDVSRCRRRREVRKRRKRKKKKKKRKKKKKKKERRKRKKKKKKKKKTSTTRKGKNTIAPISLVTFIVEKEIIVTVDDHMKGKCGSHYPEIQKHRRYLSSR